MGRLTERLHEGCYGVAECKTGCEYDNKYCDNAETTCPAVCDCLDKLGKLEDLEEQGRLLILPKVFDFEGFCNQLSGSACPHHYLLPDSEDCAYDITCEKCWEAALKGGE